MEKIDIQEYIKEAEKRIEDEKEDYLTKRNCKKLAKGFTLTTITCLAYLGLRTLFGADIIETMTKDITNPSLLESIDYLAFIWGGYLGPISSFGLFLGYREIGGNQKNIEKYERDLKIIKAENQILD